MSVVSSAGLAWGSDPLAYDDVPPGAWVLVVFVSRSYLARDVWVPATTGPYAGDQTCFLHAGGIRAVKAWAESLVGEHEQFQWRHEGDHLWEMYVRDRQ